MQENYANPTELAPSSKERLTMRPDMRIYAEETKMTKKIGNDNLAVMRRHNLVHSLILKGLNTRQIAEALGVSYDTIYRDTLYVKDEMQQQA